ncbi:hypothetical protein [Flavivirga sp. 57AJ16]|uniref:hypothetical protein n=1 Tax=Flavivirga sp. 57AJ16 TaxID=3025307 RepID=UPI00236615EE|nr:hypothetical protein [Flavivirga sp. 57AJ16]MDD7886611.1 hypothetical protein [Flavivirga sp. 57AJ16]
MGGEGAMMAANNSLKNNRSLLSKRKEKSALGGSYSNVKLAIFPEATPEQLKEIKEKIKQENKQNRQKLIIVFSLMIVLLLLVLVYFKQ